MSAEILRRAAAEMRRRADAATPGPYEVVEDPQPRGWTTVSVWSETAGVYLTEDVRSAASSVAQAHRNAEHIASWQPAVALAVADWLEDEAADADLVADLGNINPFALATAHAYLNAELPARARRPEPGRAPATTVEEPG